MGKVLTELGLGVVTLLDVMGILEGIWDEDTKHAALMQGMRIPKLNMYIAKCVKEEEWYMQLMRNQCLMQKSVSNSCEHSMQPKRFCLMSGFI